MDSPVQVRKHNKFLLVSCWVFALLPLFIVQIFGFDFYAFPAALGSGIVWLIVTIAYCYRSQSKNAKWLFALFPLALWPVIAAVALGIAFRTGNFGH